MTLRNIIKWKQRTLFNREKEVGDGEYEQTTFAVNYPAFNTDEDMYAYYSNVVDNTDILLLIWLLVGGIGVAIAEDSAIFNAMVMLSVWAGGIATLFGVRQVAATLKDRCL